MSKTKSSKKSSSKEEMSVKVVDDVLVIRIPLQEPTESASGKTMVVATTRGNQKTGVEIDGKEVIIGLNAYYKK